MTSGKKKRMSMLDSLAGATAPAPATSMMASNRALRSARDAVDSHAVWELDPACIEDNRPEDRLDQEDVLDLLDAIETNGQTVPILVRRHPSKSDHYLLVYGRRRLEAIRRSDKVHKVRALVATLDDDAAVQAQISENLARRDLSYIEKALFAASLIDSGYGTQAQVAEVLTVTKSSVSMALAIVEMVGPDLIRAIGPAHGVGRPRWDTFAKGIEETGVNRSQLIEIADKNRSKVAWSEVLDEHPSPDADPSLAAFEAVFDEVARLRDTQARPARKTRSARSDSRRLTIGGKKAGAIRRSGRGLSIDIDNGAFADWLDAHADTVMTELHARWKSGAED